MVNALTVSADFSKISSAIGEGLPLSELACVINREHQLCQEAYRVSLLHARRTGELLMLAKSKVKESPSGRWLPWLKENCATIPERTARAYMQVAREWEQIEKSAMVADFGLKDAIEFLSQSRVSQKSDACCAKSTMDAEWIQAPPSQETPFSSPISTLKERDRVVVTETHPFFSGHHGTITGRPSPDTAVVALDEGERERILIGQLQLEELKPQYLVREPKSKDKQLLPGIPLNLDVPPHESPPLTASLVNTTAIAHGQSDVVATEIALGLQHLSPEQLFWVLIAAADNGLSDAHLRAAVKAAKQMLNRRHHPEYFANKKSTTQS